MMYSLVIHLYAIVVELIAPFHKKARLMRLGQWKTNSILRNNIDPDAKYIWFHASSLGEFEQGRPVIEKIKTEHPEYKILLTFFSPSGYEVRKNYEGADVICYLPFDTPYRVNKFLNLANPAIAVFIKYEFWANYLQELKRREIPVYIISAIFRPQQIFFKWYARSYRKVLNCFNHLFVQDEASRDLLVAYGIKNVTVAGDTRFDRVLDVQRKSRIIDVVQQFIGDPGNDKQTVLVEPYVFHRTSKGNILEANYIDLRPQFDTQILGRKICFLNDNTCHCNNSADFYMNNISYPYVKIDNQDFILSVSEHNSKTLWVSLKDKVHKNRLCIPFYDDDNQIRFYQTRAVMPEDLNDNRPKYLSKLNSDKRIYGINNIDSNRDYIFIFEGPIDSMFTVNGVAICGLHLTNIQKQILQRYNLYKQIWVLDNQIIDKASKEKTMELIDRGERVFIWPEKLKKYKDFNDICINFEINEISNKFIIDNSFEGIEAKTRLKINQHR